MAFLNNTKYKEIYQAAKDGNEKAKMVLQALRKNQSQADLDRLMDDFYSIPTNTQEVQENANLSDFDASNQELEPIEEVVNEEPTQSVAEFDLTKILDEELVDLLDENEIEDLSFEQFLSNKNRDSLRERKGSAYFKAYDLNGRKEYMNNRINNYKSKFDGRLKNIERKYNDVNTSLGNYSQGVNDLLDDGVEMDMQKVSSAYDSLVNDEVTMGSFGRHWDENDNLIVQTKLRELVSEYGKQNVLAALNTINSDNENYRDHLNNQIDTEVSRYTRSIENILK